MQYNIILFGRHLCIRHGGKIQIKTQIHASYVSLKNFSFEVIKKVCLELGIILDASKVPPKKYLGAYLLFRTLGGGGDQSSRGGFKKYRPLPFTSMNLRAEDRVSSQSMRTTTGIFY